MENSCRNVHMAALCTYIRNENDFNISDKILRSAYVETKTENEHLKTMNNVLNANISKLIDKNHLVKAVIKI